MQSLKPRTSLSFFPMTAAFSIAVVLAAVVASLFGFTIPAHANPSYFARSPGTSSATTSPRFMTAGTATTTETFNTSVGTSQAMNSAVLYLFLVGSTSVQTSYATTTYNVALEYSDNGIDWGGDTYIDGGATATTSQVLSFTNPNTRNVVLGGISTLGGTVLATTTGTVRLMNVPTPTKYVRAVISIPAGSTNGAVWAQFIGKRENN